MSDQEHLASGMLGTTNGIVMSSYIAILVGCMYSNPPQIILDPGYVACAVGRQVSFWSAGVRTRYYQQKAGQIMPYLKRMAETPRMFV